MPETPGNNDDSATEEAGPESVETPAATKAEEKAPEKSSEPENLSTDDIEKLLAQASGDLGDAAETPVSAAAEPQPFDLGNLSEEGEDDDRQPMELLGDVELDLRVELGRTEMRLEEVLQLRGGSVVALDKLAGDPVDIFVNGRLIARGEVLVMNDNFCVRVTELVGA
ncbi:MAG: flagellar motor switch protein FliN [Planctomycetota bacterium]